MTLAVHRARIDGHAVSYLAGGPPDSSRVLLLLHAFPVGVRMWEPQLEAFPGWRVIAPAFPGFDSTPPASSSVEGYASYVQAFLDAHRIERTVVAGVSMGGYVAFALVRTALSRIAGVVLADTRAGADSEQGRASRVAMLDRLARDGVDGVIEEMMPKLLGATTHRTSADLVQRVTDMIRGQDTNGLAQAIHALMERPDSTPLLGTIKVPTAILVGEEDTVTPVAEAERLRAGIPGATLTQIPRVGHLSNLENPGAFNAAVSMFLERCAGTG